MRQVNLGDKVKSRVSGFVGIAQARVEWISGCVRVDVQPPLDSDGKYVESRYFDEEELDVVEPGMVRLPDVKPSGGGPDPVRPTGPPR